MENASKALLIAGAVLIVILLIGVGMMVFNGSKENVDSAMQTVSAQQVQVFNGQFSAYEGKQTGANVRALNQAVQSSNAKNTEHPVVVKWNATDVTGPQDLKSSKKYTVSFQYGKVSGVNDNGVTGYISVITIED